MKEGLMLYPDGVLKYEIFDSQNDKIKNINQDD